MDSTTTFSLVDCTNTLLAEIANKKMTQRDVAQTYHLALIANDKPDWGKVNRAIMERWSQSGLIRIKTMAANGSCFREPKKGKPGG